MSYKPKTRIVGPSRQGGWDVINPARPGKPVSHHRTQETGQKTARKDLKKVDGGELVTKNRKGVIRAKDTVAPGNDSRKRKG